MTEYYPPQGQPGTPAPLPDELPETPPPAEPPKREGFGGIVSTIAVLLIAPLIALFLTAFVFQSYQVDGPSMETTLQNNDRLLVWKLPRTWARITSHDYVPKRGDVVIFVERDNSFSNAPGKQLIKRVVGLPGERVTVKDNILTVYNKDNPDGFQPDKILPYGEVISETPGGDRDVTIPKDSIYVVGDNRNNSLDSRSFGPVELKEVVGKLVMRVWPMSNAKRF
jgi:signal peptidase I